MEEPTPEISKTVKKKGTYGRKPSLGWKCLVQLKPVSGNEGVESDYLNGNAEEITIGNGDWEADKAIESCLEMMHVNEESEFTVRLTPDTEFKIDISLNGSVEKGYIFEWTDEDKLRASKTYKADGVELFKGNRIDHAFYKFSKALKMLLLMDADLMKAENNPEGNQLLIALFNNIANCHLHFRNYVYVVELCNKSLNVLPNVKGYFRRALAYIELRRYDDAQNDLLELLKIEPKNEAAIQKYKLVRELDKTNRENYGAMIRNMFQ